MQTFTKALIDHVVEGRVDRDVAADASTNRHDFLVALDQALKRRALEDRQAAEAAEQGPPEEPVAPAALHGVPAAEPEPVAPSLAPPAPAPALAAEEPEAFPALRVARPAGE